MFSYSDRSLPTRYLVSTFWAGQEGSFLLWLLWGMIIGLPLIRYARHYEDRTLIVYNVAQLSLAARHPAQAVAVPLPRRPAAGQVPFDGQGLNPLLQNPWMTIHPPIMFLGYAATAVPFAFAIAALWGRRYDEWVKASLPWALVTVVTLGCAILLGGYWAYVTLGWGGYWGWDPVENSSLVPWIASVALVHGMLLQRARGPLPQAQLLPRHPGVRAGGVRDVPDPLRRAGRLLGALVRRPRHHRLAGGATSPCSPSSSASACCSGAGARSRPSPATSRSSHAPSSSCSRSPTLLGTAAMVLLGTSAPLITRLASKPSQVGPAFYNRVTLPIGILLATLLGVVPFLHWNGPSKDFRKRLWLAERWRPWHRDRRDCSAPGASLYTTFLLVSLFAFFSNLIKTWRRGARRRGFGSPAATWPTSVSA